MTSQNSIRIPLAWCVAQVHQRKYYVAKEKQGEFVDLYSIFTAMHICRAVFPTAKVSVRLSVTRMNCDKTNESSAEILIPYER